MSFQYPVRVDNYQCGSDVGEYLIFMVSVYDVPENFWFVEYVHFAHILMKLPFGHLKGVLKVGFDGDLAVGCLCFILHLIVAMGFDGDSF